ncbi:mannanase [Corallococcus sp. CA041A]|uniref:glycoside hydrolase family 26 protein n=1 Tax=Corallococcus sp. CA041A TaxID=2316727 RepID=UPI000EA229E3|nr:glycosyl hydrolase [Corallococcus sp. CA041A]RKH31031.1 mannanase [Corallococcus sp. CA041A]
MTHVPPKPSLSFLLAALVLCLGAGSASAQVSRTLSTPGPTAQAQKVYNLLTDLENNSRNGGTKQTIMGQHCEAQKEAYAGEYWVKVGDISGRRPGFVEFDFGPGNYRNTYAEAYVDYAVGFARDRFSYGEGIVGFSFHMSYPGASVKSWPNNFRQSWMDYNWFGRVINWQANTAEYQALLRDLSFAADKLAYLQQQGVPVLYRPFHEMNKKGSASPFWWANQDPAQYKQLWNITHDYLVKTRGLKNLIFVWSPYEWDGTYGGDPWNYYPGNDRVDVVGVDIYHGNPYFPAQFYTGLAGYNKPRMLAETDKLPVRWGDSRYGTVSELDARPWAIYSIWGDSLVYNLGTTSPNDWNVSSSHKAIKDTYGYYSTYWRVLTGGSNATYNWGALR